MARPIPGIILLPLHAAIGAEKKNRIRVGVVYCRIRLNTERLRCCRCLGQGHKAQNCYGNDRKGRCNKCGKEGHFARECKANKEEVDEFNVKLAAEAARPKMSPRVNTK